MNTNFTVEIAGYTMKVHVLPTGEDVAIAVHAFDSTCVESSMDGAYLYLPSKKRHLIWFAQDSLTTGVVVHESLHIAIRNMESPSGNFEEDLALRVEEVFEILNSALRVRGLLRP